MIHGPGGAFIDPRNRSNLCFYFRKTHSRPAHLQESAFAPFDPEIAFLILPGQVAGTQPAIAEDAMRFFRII